MSELIKSVRVRAKDGTPGDFKASLYSENVNNYRFEWTDSLDLSNSINYKREGSYENFSNYDFINDGISVKSREKDPASSNLYYEIIQDPWSDTPPTWRSFGYDPYYFNNGSVISINWYYTGIPSTYSVVSTGTGGTGGTGSTVSTVSIVQVPLDKSVGGKS
jgi:hypothetical protein